MATCNIFDYLCQTSAVTFLVFGAATVLFMDNALHRPDRWRGFSVFAGLVSLAAALVYLANFVGLLPNPIPAVIGRNLVAALGFVLLVTAILIRRR